MSEGVKQHVIRIVVVLLCACAQAGWASSAGRLCYVAIEGADSNPGTEARP